MPKRIYLSFMDDAKLLHAIGKLYQSYVKAFSEKTLKDLNKNIIDPFKFQFDTAFLYQDNPELTIQNEIFRQNDKSIANAVGLFHQQLLGAIDGFEESPSLPCDVRKKDDTVFVEVKNKHNTMNVRSAAGVYDELSGLAKSYPKAMCYLVEIIAKRSMDEVWSLTVNETVQSNRRIHKISADRFYALATGDHDAFLKLCAALPIAIRDFLMAQQGAAELWHSKSKVYEEVCGLSDRYDADVVAQIYRIALPDYGNF